MSRTYLKLPVKVYVLLSKLEFIKIMFIKDVILLRGYPDLTLRGVEKVQFLMKFLLLIQGLLVRVRLVKFIKDSIVIVTETL